MSGEEKGNGTVGFSLLKSMALVGFRIIKSFQHLIASELLVTAHCLGASILLKTNFVPTNYALDMLKKKNQTGSNAHSSPSPTTGAELFPYGPKYVPITSLSASSPICM